MYSKVTHDIRIIAMPLYVPEQSFPDDNIYTWIYNIAIQNKRLSAVKLMYRHWQITDGYGEKTEVKGNGVVGEQPVIGAGQVFEYTSSCQLRCNSGIMVGKYFFHTLDGKELEVDIPAFSLDVPFNSYTIN